MTVLAFDSKTRADAVLKEVAATPDGGVWVWFDPDSNENIVHYAVGIDGRCATAHHFDEIDRDWLEAYLEGMAGVQVLDALPADWQYPQEE